MKRASFRTLCTLATLLVGSLFVSAQITVGNAGTYHNQFLGQYFTSGKPQINLANMGSQVPVASAFFCNLLRMQNGRCPACDSPTRGNTLAAQFIQEQLTIDKASLFDARISTITNVAPISPREQTFVLQLKGILTSQGSISSMSNGLNALKNSFNSASTSTIFKEWFGGVLSISTSSAQYWGNPANPIAPVPTPQGFLMGDALGFLAGWGAQLISDYNSPGGVNPGGEAQRIEQGIWGATIGSCATPI